jgi:mRNA degradation ribonuclease J1/J2
MARVFNICFKYQGKPYIALVSVNGKEDSSVKVTTNNETIQIFLPTGRLIFSIADVLQRLYASSDKTSSNTIFHVTPNISLQLMNTEW